MTYNLYCYKSVLFSPVLAEAVDIIEKAKQKMHFRKTSYALNELKIHAALINFNPKLYPFALRNAYHKIKTGHSISPGHWILTTQKDELALQIIISDVCAIISVPCWYKNEQATDVFGKVDAYTKIIRQKVSYFVFDPQANKVYDPWLHDFNDLSIYQHMYEQPPAQYKLRWKFWQ